MTVFRSLMEFASTAVAALLLTVGQWAVVQNGSAEFLLLFHVVLLIAGFMLLRLVRKSWWPDYRCDPEQTFWNGMTGFSVERDTMIWIACAAGLVYGIPVLSGSVQTPDHSSSWSLIAAVLVIPLTGLSVFITWQMLRGILWTLPLAMIAGRLLF